MEVTTNPIFDDVSIAFTSKSDRQLKKAYWLFSLMGKGWLVTIGKFFVKLGYALRLPISGIIYHTVYDQFCGGVTIKDSQGTIDELASHGIGTILDYSVEGAKNEKGYDATMQEVLRTIDRSANDEHLPFCVFKPTGMSSSKVFEKIQAGKELTEKVQGSYDRSKARIEKICQTAFDNNVRILIDAEEILHWRFDKEENEKKHTFNTFFCNNLNSCDISIIHNLEPKHYWNNWSRG
jgi:proline dehydrogenase